VKLIYEIFKSGSLCCGALLRFCRDSLSCKGFPPSGFLSISVKIYAGLEEIFSDIGKNPCDLEKFFPISVKIRGQVLDQTLLLLRSGPAPVQLSSC
jgi:hypothetical protein